MFDSKQTLTTRLADATDLIIDFATLGEYGLEPVGSTPEGCDGSRQHPMPIADRTTFTEVLFPNTCDTRRRSPQARAAAAANGDSDGEAFGKQAIRRRRTAWRSSATRAGRR
jgi:hypothetical protein